MSNSNIHSSDNQRRFSAQEMSLGSVIHVSPAEDWDTPQIISPPITIAIAIFSSGVVALLIWAVTYRLPIYASSKGLLYQSPKLSSVTVKTDGLIDDIYVKVRSTGKLLKAKIDLQQTNRAIVNLKISEDGISPGQACVFYQKDNLGYKVLGGGWIKA